MGTRADVEPVQTGILARYWVHIAVSVFVIAASFLYGIQHGLSTKVQPANAALGPAGATMLDAEQVAKVTSEFGLARGLKLIPMGHDVSINGRKADVLSFITSRGIRDLTREQRAIWQSRGLKVHDFSTGKRGVIFARRLGTDEFLSFIVWHTPHNLRKVASIPAAVQGVVSISTREIDPDADFSEHRGEVPGVSMMPGGRAGAVFSARDFGGKTYSSVYTVPADLSAAMFFYETDMKLQGWRPGGKTTDEKQGALTFRKNKEELVLLFSAKPFAPKDETVVFVTIFPAASAHLFGGSFQ